MKSRRSPGIDVKFTKLLKIIAAIRMVNSIAVVRALSTRMSISTRGVSDPRSSANMNAPAAPTPAPSVAVNTPP
jgi:hypothetical protein